MNLCCYPQARMGSGEHLDADVYSAHKGLGILIHLPEAILRRSDGCLLNPPFAPWVYIAPAPPSLPQHRGEVSLTGVPCPSSPRLPDITSLSHHFLPLSLPIRPLLPALHDHNSRAPAVLRRHSAPAPLSKHCVYSTCSRCLCLFNFPIARSVSLTLFPSTLSMLLFPFNAISLADMLPAAPPLI